MAALALTVIAEFSMVQELIDDTVRVYVWQKAPSLRAFLTEQGILDRIPDSQRPRFILALAGELKIPADLSKFTDVFHRVKEVRDHLAHAVTMEPIDANTLRATKGYMVTPLTKPGKEPRAVTFTRQQLMARLHDARWLWQHVFFMFLTWHGDGQIPVGDAKGAVLQPPACPEDWDGTMATSLA